jgi:superfamily II DNA or RNA helicase
MSNFKNTKIKINKPVPKKIQPISPEITEVLSQEYKIGVSNCSYLGRRGYVIPKSVLSAQDLLTLREELVAKPVINGPTYGVNPESLQFPVFRENDKKMYIPRFYGIARYGIPETSKIHSHTVSINVPFVKTLRDYQEDIVDTYLNHVSSPLCKNESAGNGGGGLLEVATGSGKTIMALNIISKIGKKTLIIVHKEFLANQWKERIEEYIPSAKVGRIQGTIFDVKDRDIVIGMVQTLYNRDYGETAFQEFGLTIIDEVHRIGSEEFSKTLLQISTPLMLGISATVDRKDGLEKLLYMFIGNKAYIDKRKSEHAVSVRSIEYVTNDVEFNKTILDFRGNPAYSSMISKLCAFVPRTEFIVKVIFDLIVENPNSQIMLLSHQRALLTKIFDLIQLQNAASPTPITTIGYYVGGMKQEALKETETKQIVLATFSMAAEALDIKTLSTLFMITPKTDIVQSVGRILRTKHDTPIIVDLVDKHSVFKNQFIKRKKLYKERNYHVHKIESSAYTGFTDLSKWTCVNNSRKMNAGSKPEPEIEAEQQLSQKSFIDIDNL